MIAIGFKRVEIKDEYSMKVIKVEYRFANTFIKNIIFIPEIQFLSYIDFISFFEDEQININYFDINSKEDILTDINNFLNQ